MQPHSAARDLLLEIGTEEIPARFFAGALKQLADRAAAALQAARLEHGAIDTFGTPRRLAVRVRSVSLQQKDLAVTARGPARQVAFDADGNPTKAAQGFARGQGVAVSDLVVEATEQGEYVFARKVEQGRPAPEVLPDLLRDLVTGLEFPGSMRWADRSLRFARPIHWLLALCGDTVVQFDVDGIASGNTTRGHRFFGSGRPVVVPDVSRYAEVLHGERVIADVAQRRAAIWEQVQQQAASLGGYVADDPDLLEEVTFLVEWPRAVTGRFDAAFLEIPAEVLVTSMKAHQRYFPVHKGERELLPCFVAVVNGEGDAYALNAARGSERVLRARLADARFFFAEDRKADLASRVPGLAKIVFQEKLGTLLQKTERVEALTRIIGGSMGLGEDAIAAAARAARLSKADLLTHMVYEFTELEGVMGREYALLDGEPAAVATAIYEHLLPRGAGDDLPATRIGQAVALADKLDTLAGFFGVGLIPTGSADPYALRRAAQGVTLILVDAAAGLSLPELLQAALAGYAGTAAMRPAADVQRDLMEFFTQRLSGLLRERGVRYDVVDAVLAAGFTDPADALRRATTLAALLAAADFAQVLTAFRRVANLGAKAAAGPQRVDAELFEQAEEHALWRAFKAFADAAQPALAAGRYADFYRGALALKEPVDAFLDHVLVMAEEPAVRANRLGMLSEVAALLSQPADLSKLVV